MALGHEDNWCLLMWCAKVTSFLESSQKSLYSVYLWIGIRQTQIEGHSSRHLLVLFKSANVMKNTEELFQIRGGDNRRKHDDQMHVVSWIWSRSEKDWYKDWWDPSPKLWLVLCYFVNFDNYIVFLWEAGLGMWGNYLFKCSVIL